MVQGIPSVSGSRFMGPYSWMLRHVQTLGLGAGPRFSLMKALLTYSTAPMIPPTYGDCLISESLTTLALESLQNFINRSQTVAVVRNLGFPRQTKV
jgi:hypothetical protein